MYPIDTVKLICGKDADIQDVIEIEEPANMKGQLVPVLFSSFPRKFTMDFTFGEPARFGYVIAEYPQFAGEEINGRRLTSNVGGDHLAPGGNLRPRPGDSEQSCEYFFLFASGGDEASLPDTWQEARQIFQHFCCHTGLSPEKCERHATSIFRGLSDDDAFQANAKVCTALTQVASASEDWSYEFGIRRLKGGTGGVSHGSSQSGYSAGSLANKFRPGIAVLQAYGIAGIAVIGAGMFLAGNSLHWGYRTDKFELLGGETKLTRYDLLANMFVKDDFNWPLRLVVTDLDDYGQINDRSLCNGTSDEPVIYPNGRLFFALAEAEDLEDDEGRPGWAVVLLVVGGMLLALFFVAAIIHFVRRPRRKQLEHPTPQKIANQ